MMWVHAAEERLHALEDCMRSLHEGATDPRGPAERSAALLSEIAGLLKELVKAVSARQPAAPAVFRSAAPCAPSEPGAGRTGRAHASVLGGPDVAPMFGA